MDEGKESLRLLNCGVGGNRGIASLEGKDTRGVFWEITEQEAP